MPITITGPSDQIKYEIVSKIIGAVSRDITFVYIIATEICPTCSGFDPFCITCSGLPFIESSELIVKKASVKWGPSEDKIYTANGQYIDGDCMVIFAIPENTNTEVTDNLLQNTRHVLVDDRKCIIDKWYYKGQPINRVHVILREDENLNGKRMG